MTEMVVSVRLASLSSFRFLNTHILGLGVHKHLDLSPFYTGEVQYAKAPVARFGECRAFEHVIPSLTGTPKWSISKNSDIYAKSGK